MKTYIFAGKGGVGKTNSAVALGLLLSKSGQKTVIIDYDGGHSVKNTLGVGGEVVPNVIDEVDEKLSVAVIENTGYKTILQARQEGIPIKQYFSQFPGDSGIIPFGDMLHCFFGAPTDISGPQKFALLVSIMMTIIKDGYENVIIDVEPTAGLERLLSGADSMVRSLRNLSKTGRVTLTVLGAKWPDIASYLKSDFFANVDRYAKRIEDTVAVIKAASFFIVCTPESGPIRQTFEVREGSSEHSAGWCEAMW